MIRCLRCSSVLDVPSPLHVDTVVRCESFLPKETGRVFADGMRELASSGVPCSAKHVLRNGNLLLVHEGVDDREKQHPETEPE